ncbi:Beta-glucosidase, lactase phlorizinhydrolase [Handroanthus impetiginosus]|uniref:Beta-glucosidase, lactase phlorizinhydrolase n=1 Tax=Handroanthus impetiginosus TaxID=429701 RepID=A0A2G9GI54_9LAMI|nr:Beta-glucosidase, lactase phlorizinhydrolase [Handroanthus impetiginosus]
MASQNSLMLLCCNEAPVPSKTMKITRNDFKPDFVFGAATSAYQIEGAFADGGKGLSNWDTFTLGRRDKIADGSNGCVAIDGYNLYKEDVKTIKKVGLDAYRFSIAWSRVLPGGRLGAGINKEGIKYYSDLIDALLAEGIEPHVTLFHWDIPQCLENEYGGFLNKQIIDDFLEYVELCFWEFGDRVKYWITLNEPWTFTNHGYVEGKFPPGHGAPQPPQTPIPQHKSHCKVTEVATKGDPGTEPYIVAHNLILAHAKAVDLYRRQFQQSQKGKIGITNVSKWFEPLNDTKADQETAKRCVDFMLGWFVAPVVTGYYPPIMRKLVAERLPKFSHEEKNLVIGSYDFLGINYYTTNYVTYTPKPEGTVPPKGDSDWTCIVRRGIRSLLHHIKKTYNNPPIYITENGVSEVNDENKTISEARSDDLRINECVNVKGYFIRSLFDNFEWEAGYTVRFGIFYVGYKDGRFTRYPKKSAIWWKNFLVKKAKLKRQVEQMDDAESVKRLRNGLAYE